MSGVVCMNRYAYANIGQIKTASGIGVGKEWGQKK
jgi:hypothetical protein